MDQFRQKLHSHEPEALSPIKTPPFHSHTAFPITAVAITGILAIAFLLVGYYIFVIKCCQIDLLRLVSFSRRRRIEDPLMVHSPFIENNRGLDEAAIRSIPILQFTKKTEFQDYVECSVCLNEFQEYEKLRVIPNCGHVFHIDCIDIWLQNSDNCPLCRTSISAPRPDITRFPLEQIFAPNPNSPSARDSDPNYTDGFVGRDEDYVVIEVGSEQSPSLPRIQETLNSNEVSDKKLGFRNKKIKKPSMGDECIPNRKKDEEFTVEPLRRSFSMDYAAGGKLYLAVQEIIHMERQVICEFSTSEGCSRNKRSFFSFGQSRSAVQVQPFASETRD